MADKDGNIIAKDYGIGIKPPAQHFHVKGHENAGWGMKARLSQIFAADGRTIMLAFDHGYIMGSTAGLERLDLVIPPLMDHADCLMATRGALRTCIPADNRKAIALRCSADSSVLKDDMSMGVIGTDIDKYLARLQIQKQGMDMLEKFIRVQAADASIVDDVVDTSTPSDFTNGKKLHER